MEKADALVSLSEFLQNDKELANQVAMMARAKARPSRGPPTDNLTNKVTPAPIVIH